MKPIYLAIIVLLVLIALLVPIVPTNVEVQETYTQTKTNTLTSTILLPRTTTTQTIFTTTTAEVVQVPVQVPATTQWQVEWSTITGEGLWGAPVGSSTFPSAFDYDWSTGRVFGAYSDYIGFKATAVINVQRSGPTSFTIGSDDGARLFIDGQLVVDNWQRGGYRTKSAVVTLTIGKHTLELQYYEITGEARVSFKSDSDVLTWQETRYQTQTQIKTTTQTTTQTITVTQTTFTTTTQTTEVPATRTVTKTEFVSILQQIVNTFRSRA